MLACKDAVQSKAQTQGSCDTGWTYTSLSSSTVAATSTHSVIEVETWKCTCDTHQIVHGIAVDMEVFSGAGSACPADGELGPRVKYDFHANVPTANEADAATKKDGTIDKMKAL